MVYIASTDGNMYALDQETGKQKWKFNIRVATGYFITNGANGVVYFGSTDGLVYAIY